MVRAADLELEFNQFQENTNGRLTTLENELAAMRLEANQRHEQTNQRHEQSNQRHEQTERLGRLKPDLRASVRVMRPEGLNHAMILAVTIEENKGFDIGARGGGSYRSGGTTSNFSGYKNNTTSSTRTLLSTASTGTKGGISSTGRVSQFKRLTELADKRSKGLCFKCDQKFGPVHICASRSLQVLLVDEEEEYEEEDGEELKMATDHDT
ncbi:hypothetical protein Tco_1329890 [Tanacetum coccineum]